MSSLNLQSSVTGGHFKVSFLSLFKCKKFVFLFSLKCNKNFPPFTVHALKSNSWSDGCDGVARPGHLVYCFGDVDSRYCRGLSGSAGSDYIMKQIWLEFNEK